MRGKVGTVAIGLMGLVAVGAGASWIAGSIMVAGHRSRVVASIAPQQDLRLRTCDGVTIAATFTPGRNDRSPAILLLHGVGASRDAVAANAAWLSRLGYATLAIDFRGHGQSDLTPRSFGLQEALDAQAAFKWLKWRQRGAPIAVIGISLGGAASLLGSAGPLPADALILQAVYPDIRHAIRNRIASRTTASIAYVLEPLLSFQARWRYGVWPARLSPIATLPRYRGAVFVIGGQHDRSTPAEETRAMFDAARGFKQLWLVPEGDHAEICGLTDAGYRNRVKAFLETTIGPP